MFWWSARLTDRPTAPTRKKQTKNTNSVCLFSSWSVQSLYKDQQHLFERINQKPHNVGEKGSHGYNIVVNTIDIKRTSDRTDVVSKGGMREWFGGAAGYMEGLQGGRVCTKSGVRRGFFVFPEVPTSK